MVWYNACVKKENTTRISLSILAPSEEIFLEGYKDEIVVQAKIGDKELIITKEGLIELLNK